MAHGTNRNVGIDRKSSLRNRRIHIGIRTLRKTFNLLHGMERNSNRKIRRRENILRKQRTLDNNLHNSSNRSRLGTDYLAKS